VSGAAGTPGGVEGRTMTEKNWLASVELMPMLKFLRAKAGTRTVRLFAVACCRRIWHLLTDDPSDDQSRQAVEVAELAADGGATPEQSRAVDPSSRAAIAVTTCVAFAGVGPLNNWVNRLALVAEDAAIAAADAALGGTHREVDAAAWEAAFDAELAAQCALLRDICGNPFRPVPVSPGWQTPQVVALAQAAYDQRELPAGTLDQACLAVLADALEEAGCTDLTILGHLRGPGPHVRGCWAVDLILGKG
jgi:hypothetical protein